MYLPLVIAICVASASANFANYQIYKESPQSREFKSVADYAVANGFHNFEEQFNNFKTEFGRRYEAHEVEERQFNFLRTLSDIEENEALFEAGEVTHKLGITKFSDWSIEEYNNFLMPDDFLVINHENSVNLTELRTKRQTAASLDLRTRNVVSPVKDQKQCGDCWSFATAATVEINYAIKNGLTGGSIVQLSEQEMLDCVRAPTYPNTQGCNGGQPADAYKYVKAQGLTTESSYPYTQKQGTCRGTTFASNTKVHISDYKQASSAQNGGLKDADIMSAVSAHGATMVYINAKDTNFMNYKSGILSVVGTTTGLNHVLTAVGYGTEGGVDYWIIKNSWGTAWGEKGFVRLRRGVNSHGINNIIDYPVV